MISLEVDVNGGKVRFRSREFHGIDRPEWTTIDEMDADRVESFAKRLLDLAAKARDNATRHEAEMNAKAPPRSVASKPFDAQREIAKLGQRFDILESLVREALEAKCGR